MSDRVVIFVDYQNAYKGAREAFFESSDHHYCGQFNPRQLGEVIANDSPYDRELQEVRVYRGIPSLKHDPKGYGASRRQIANWDTLGKVTPVVRPLRYPEGWPDQSLPGDSPGEKGIDVSLAIDFASMAVRHEFEVGIIFSADSDLKPALEFVCQLAADAGSYYPRAEVAGWKSLPGRRSPRLGIADRNLYCHKVDRAQFDVIADAVDYARKWA